MTKVLKMLGSIGLAAMLGMALLGASSAFAESPPNPPSRFAGTVKIDGANAPAGTTIEARIGSTSCGVTTTFNQGGNGNYVIDVPALDPGATPNCGTENAAVAFFVGGRLANETGSWKNYQLSLLNLTVTSATATPATTTPGTATPGTATPGTGTPGAGTTPAATVTSTPRGPSTGNGTQPSDGASASILLFAALGLGAVAFGVGGAAVSRRGR